MARPAKPSAEQPVQIIGAEIRLYESEPDLLAFFAQYKSRQYATAIKRAIRAALSGGGLEMGGQFALPVTADDDEDDGFDDFVS